MKRYKITLLVVCCYLLYLGFTDVSLTLNNPEPQPVDAQQLIEQGAPRDWLTVEGGTLDLTDAVSTSGELEIEALLVPLHSSSPSGKIHLLLETTDQNLINAFTMYYIQLETDLLRKEFLEKNRDAMFVKGPRTGMVTSGLVAANNRSRMLKLAKQIGLNVDEDVVFISEGKQPPKWRGFFYLIVGVAGLIKVWTNWRSTKGPLVPNVPSDNNPS